MINNIEIEIIEIIKKNQEISSKEIFKSISKSISYATVKRMISKLMDDNLVTKKGQGRATKYLISPTYEVLFPIDMVKYFEKEIVFTKRAKKVLESAWKKAKKHKKSRILSEHLLYAITKEPNSIAMKALEQLGVDAVEIKQGILKEIGE